MMKKYTLFLVLILTTLLLVSCGTESNTQIKEQFTLEKFDAIETGMTYEEVMAIVKVEGTVTDEGSIGDGDNEIQTKTYTWEGNIVKGPEDASVTLMFHDGKLARMSHMGLE
ncbi:hypothetical protein LJC20_07100 [Eubacteriales bacterium OttesenSCG-928-M02]|nr:hypothetical protein [Eubacteriales bacterium OttesenSCG-928-M02]